MFPRALLPTASLCLALLVATAAWANDDAGATALSPAERSFRILELERGIQDARERLAELVSTQPEPDAPSLREDPELAAIARSLTRMTEELRQLRAGIQADASP